MATTGTAAPEPEVLSVVYDGGLAAHGELHFYEYGRAAYALARLIATIEHFRRTGSVAKRITSGSYVSLLIQAPERGSFPIDVIIPIIMEGRRIVTEYDIPVGLFLKYIIHTIRSLSPKQEDTIIELAKLDLRREGERTLQSKQETERLRETRKMVKSQNIVTTTALGVLEKALRRPDPRIAEIGATQSEMLVIKNQLLELQKREQEFEGYHKQLGEIDDDGFAQLIAKVRPQLAEVGLPLNKSATTATFAAGSSKDNFATFDLDAIRDINSRSLDAAPTEVELRIFAYDRDAGVGRCDLNDFGIKRIAFSIPVGLRSRLRKKVLAAIDVDVVNATARFFKNKDGYITSLLVEGIEVDSA